LVERSAWLVDDSWPEFDRWTVKQPRDRAVLLAPLDGTRWNKPNYAWTRAGFGAVKTHPLFALGRSIASRRLASQGAARQRALQRFEAKLARLYARRLGPEITHLVVAQTLLPHLEREGVLGGRTVDVLLMRAPLASLQATLDRAAKQHPDSTTLGDFRADPAMVEAETKALVRARRVVTPHRALAAEFPGRAELLDWATPVRGLGPFHHASGFVRVGFLGPTLGRKGAWEAREALLKLTVPHLAIVLGGQLEAPDFWNSLACEFRREIRPDTLADLDIVLSPAWVEHRPRVLIALLAAGHHVVATTACGLAEHPRLTVVEPGDSNNLVKVLQDLCQRLGP